MDTPGPAAGQAFRSLKGAHARFTVGSSSTERREPGLGLQQGCGPPASKERWSPGPWGLALLPGRGGSWGGCGPWLQLTWIRGQERGGGGQGAGGAEAASGGAGGAGQGGGQASSPVHAAELLTSPGAELALTHWRPTSTPLASHLGCQPRLGSPACPPCLRPPCPPAGAILALPWFWAPSPSARTGTLTPPEPPLCFLSLDLTPGGRVLLRPAVSLRGRCSRFMHQNSSAQGWIIFHCLVRHSLNLCSTAITENSVAPPPKTRNRAVCSWW